MVLPTPRAPPREVVKARTSSMPYLNCTRLKLAMSNDVTVTEPPMLPVSLKEEFRGSEEVRMNMPRLSFDRDGPRNKYEKEQFTRLFSSI